MAIALDDPVAIRELTGIARRRRTYVLRTVYVGLLGVLLWIIWKGQTAGAALGVSEYADVGRWLFRGFYLFQMVFLSLAPTSTAFEIFHREIRSGAVDLLLLTPRSSFSLTAGKWKAATVEGAGYALCGAPVLAACAFLGAVGPVEIAWAVSTSVLQAGLAAAVAIHYAAQPRPAPPRLSDAIATVWFWHFGLLLGFVFLQLGVFAACVIHPFYAGLFALFGTGSLQEIGETGWIFNLAGCPLVILFLLRRASRFDVRLIPTAAAASHVAVPSGVAPVPELHPLLWKELRLREAGWATSGQRWMLLFFLTVMAALFWLATHEHGLFGFALVGVPLAIAMVFNGAFLFHQEEDRKRWDLLLTTPLTPLRIVATKLAAGLVAPEAKYLLLLLGAAIVGWGYRLPGTSLLLMAAVTALFLGFIYLASAAGALFLRSRTSGGFLCAGLLFLLLAALPWIRFMSEGRAGPDWTAALDAAFRSLHPFAIIGPLDRTTMDRFDDPMRPGHVAAFFAVYGTAVALLLPALVRRVARIGRGER